MKKVIQKEGLPIKLWLDDIEDGAMAQAENLAQLPFSKMNKKTAEELYQKFRGMGYTHQQARELALKAQDFELEDN